MTFMSRIFFCILVLACAGVFAESKARLFSDKSDQQKYYWKENYQEAFALAKEGQKALLLVFVGSDWCPWSEKLQEEVLVNETFLKELSNDVVFVWVDFPEKLEQPEDKKSENLRLKNKFAVHEFPSLVLMDLSEQEITKLGYLPMPPQEFSVYLKGLLSHYRELQPLVEGPQLKDLNEVRLEEIYTKAQCSGFNRFKDMILEAGLKRNKGPFFLLEKYTTLLECGKKKKDLEVQTLRDEIIKRDPKNEKGSHLRLALLDFQLLATKYKKKDKTETVVEPLMEYVKRFGSKDKENTWRVEMMIAQYLFSKKIIGSALEHAKASYDTAPDILKPEIEETIKYLKSCE